MWYMFHLQEFVALLKYYNGSSVCSENQHDSRNSGAGTWSQSAAVYITAALNRVRAGG